jgi:hypothetical protein
MKPGFVAAFVSLFVFAGSASAQSAWTATDGGFTVGAEALLWWFKGNPMPPLASDGTIGDPGTTVRSF